MTNARSEQIVSNIDELHEFAENFIRTLSKNQRDHVSSGMNAVIVGLSGDLGAGKTTFSQQVARILGVKAVVNSPTFVIQKNYETNNPLFKRFVHIDAYRLESGEEIEKLKFKDLLDAPNTLIFIEWPEKISEILPKNTIMLSFESIDENTRKISY